MNAKPEDRETILRAKTIATAMDNLGRSPDFQVFLELLGQRGDRLAKDALEGANPIEREEARLKRLGVVLAIGLRDENLRAQMNVLKQLGWKPGEDSPEDEPVVAP